MRDILSQRYNSNPDKVFIYYKNEKYTYCRFSQIVEYIYHFVLNKNFDKYVNIDMNNKVNLFAAIIACNRARKIPIMISDIEKSDINFSRSTVIHKDINEKKDNRFSYDEDSTQVVVYSSGTSGDPKGIELSFNSFYKNSEMWNDAFRFDSGDIYCNILSLKHVGGLCIMFRALYNNFSVIVDDYSNIEKCKLSYDYISLVPAMLYDIVDKNTIDSFLKIKKIFIGGSSFNSNVLKQAIDKKLPLYAVYGMTETCSGIAGAKINNLNYNNLIYESFKDVNITVDNNKISIQSPSLMKKYLYSNKVIDKFSSNDLGILCENGFKVLGRSDQVIISGGENFDSKLIKDAINCCPGVLDAKISFIDDEKWINKIVAYIKTDSSALKKQDIFNFLDGLIPQNMMPKEISFVKKIDDA
tara:strand:+ start:83 stop:1321 length:1239 start_codon:yes stop_codon:yes gene_type:complete